MMKKVYLIAAVLLLMTMVSACTERKDANQSHSEKFNLTITENTGADVTVLKSKCCILDERKGNLKTVVRLEHNAQYSLTYCDVKNGIVYYVTNEDGSRRGGDQLYSYDMNTGNHRQLTEGIYAINFIVPINENKLLLVAVVGGTHNISPLCYDIKSGKLESWEWDDDFFVNYAFRDSQTGTVYISGYSNAKDYQMRDQLNNREIEKYGIDNYIYRIDKDGKYEKIFTCKDRYITSFAVNGKVVLCMTKVESFDDADYKVVRYDVDSKEEKTLKNISIPGDIIDLDDSGENVYSSTGGQIIKTNLSLGTEETIYKVDREKEYINNAQRLP